MLISQDQGRLTAWLSIRRVDLPQRAENSKETLMLLLKVFWVDYAAPYSLWID